MLTSADVELYTTGKVNGSASSVDLTGYTLVNGATGRKFELTTWNTEDLPATDTNTGIDVTYTAPLTPTYVVTAVPASGYIQLAITDPTPSGTPTVTSHSVYVRVAAGGIQDGERPVGGDGIRIATGITTPYLDYAAGAGIDYEYRTLALGDNGAVAFGEWT